MPLHLTWEGLGITNNPGVTSTTLLFERWEDCADGKCKECNDPTKHPELKIDPESRSFGQDDFKKILKDLGLIEALELEYCEKCGKFEKKTRQ